MCYVRIYKVTTSDNNVHYYRDRKELLEFLRVYLEKPLLKLTSVDNYIQKKNVTPSKITLETSDIYEFLKEDIKNVYGDSLKNKCSKTIQKKAFSLFDDLYRDGTSPSNKQIEAV